VERAKRIEIVEDVGVFVEWRAVTNLDEVVDDDGTGGQRREPVTIGGRQRLVRPADRVARDRIEPLRAFEPGPDLVVIAANERVGRDFPDLLDDRVRVRAVPDEIAEHQDLVVADRLRCDQHCIERLHIRVNVTENEVSHYRRAAGH
jgi:hypothetical protein